MGHTKESKNAPQPNLLPIGEKEGLPAGKAGMRGKIVAISISRKKGVKKMNVSATELLEGLGLKGDAHAEGGIRQVSLLAQESIDKMRKKGLDVKPGDFAENITTQGIDLLKLPVGTQIKIGDTSLLEISQHGKTCHSRCAIYYSAGDCVMPTEGVFARVLKDGKIAEGNLIEIVEDNKGRKGNK